MTAVTFTRRTKLTELVPSVAVNSMLSSTVSEPSWLYLLDKWKTELRFAEWWNKKSDKGCELKSVIWKKPASDSLAFSHHLSWRQFFKFLRTHSNELRVGFLPGLLLRAGNIFIKDPSLRPQLILINLNKAYPNTYSIIIKTPSSTLVSSSTESYFFLIWSKTSRTLVLLNMTLIVWYG